MTYQISRRVLLFALLTLPMAEKSLGGTSDRTRLLAACSVSAKEKGIQQRDMSRFMKECSGARAKDDRKFAPRVEPPSQIQQRAAVPAAGN